MEISIESRYMANISELIKNNRAFSFLSNHKISDSAMFEWEYCGKTSKVMQVIVIGKSGYGKSTTLNKLIGKDVFASDAIGACTKKNYSADYQLKQPDQFFSLCDLPGIGESTFADKKYFKWYNEMLQNTTVVVYMLRADQRDFSLDLDICNKLFKNPSCKKQILLAINCADKIEPINRASKLSDLQKNNLNRKVEEIKRVFQTKHVVAYSAETGYNFGLFTNKLAQMILNHKYQTFC